MNHFHLFKKMTLNLPVPVTTCSMVTFSDKNQRILHNSLNGDLVTAFRAEFNSHSVAGELKTSLRFSTEPRYDQNMPPTPHYLSGPVRSHLLVIG